MHECARECEALLEAKRQCIGIEHAVRPQIELFLGPAQACRAVHRAKTIGICEEPQILHNTQISVQGKFLRHIADVAARLRTRVPRVGTRHEQFA